MCKCGHEVGVYCGTTHASGWGNFSAHAPHKEIRRATARVADVPKCLSLADLLAVVFEARRARWRVCVHHAFAAALVLLGGTVRARFLIVHLRRPARGLHIGHFLGRATFFDFCLERRRCKLADLKIFVVVAEAVVDR